MARKPRIEFPGAFYHVIARGNNKQKVFIDDEDYKIFLDRLKFYKEKFKFIVYAYVLMPNHIHMLIETGDIPLSRIMQALQFTYTQKFNYRHKKSGHLFQGRYKAILCQKEAYLMELIRYISLNPVRAFLVKRPLEWRWGSFADLFQTKKDHVVSVDEVLKIFGKQRHIAIKNLQKFINDGLTDGHNETYYKLKDQRVLGEKDFADKVVKIGDMLAGDFEYYNIDITTVVKLVAKHMNIKTEQIRSPSSERLGAKARGVVAYICKTFCDKTVKDVSSYFGKDNAPLSRMMRRIEQENNENKEIGELMRMIETEIKNNYHPCAVREIKANKANKQA